MTNSLKKTSSKPKLVAVSPQPGRFWTHETIENFFYVRRANYEIEINVFSQCLAPRGRGEGTPDFR